MTAGPSVEQSIWQHYQFVRPGEVQVLGADFFFGNASQVANFRNLTGATYPLLLCGNCGSGNENLAIPYADRDNWVVINKQGIIRYHAADYWAYGARYHLDEIRGAVDTLVTNLADAPELAPSAFLLGAAPNPFQSRTTLEFANPTAHELAARVTVHDLAGRRVATLWDSPAPRGRTTVTWDGRSEGGEAAAAGVYVIRAQLGAVTLSRRLVRIR